MHDQPSRSARLRYTATGALAALAIVGGVAGAAALAAKPAARPAAKAQGRAAAATAAADGGATKAPSACAGAPDKAPAPQPGSDQPFLNDVQQLVAAGTITAAEGQAVDREIQAGRIDTDTLASSGFTPAQLQALQTALQNTKRGLAAAAQSGSSG